MPVPAALALPQSGAQLATVVENADPLGLGRVRVQFGWQEEDSKTPWLRVLTPDAGSSNVVNKNRGFVFVPELGDSVLVDFEQGNPDAPFVLGSVFHGKNGAGGGIENVGKSISTRSGHTVELSDKGEGTHIIIRDPGGNEIYLDTVGKNITITAPETMTFNANNVVVNAKQNITLNAGDNIAESAGKNVTVQAGQDIIQSATGDIKESADSKTEVIEKDYTRRSQNSVEHADAITAFSNQENMVLKSSKTIEFNSSEKTNLF
jgi:uncharacterized protein involved in type VI secretion and phage assembly